MLTATKRLFDTLLRIMQKLMPLIRTGNSKTFLISFGNVCHFKFFLTHWSFMFAEGAFFRKTAFFTHFDRVQNAHTIRNALYIDYGRSDRSSEDTLHIWSSFRRAIGHLQNNPWGGGRFFRIFCCHMHFLTFLNFLIYFCVKDKKINHTNM